MTELTRRDFMKLTGAAGFASLVPGLTLWLEDDKNVTWITGEPEQVIFTDYMIDDDLLNSAISIKEKSPFIIDGQAGISASLDIGKVWGAISLRDDTERKWTTPDKGLTWQTNDGALAFRLPEGEIL